MDRFEKHARELMERGDRISAEKAHRTRIIKRVSLGGAAMAAAIVGVFAVHSAPPAPDGRFDVSEIIVTETVTAADTTRIAALTTTAKPTRTADTTSTASETASSSHTSSSETSAVTAEYEETQAETFTEKTEVTASERSAQETTETSAEKTTTTTEEKTAVVPATSGPPVVDTEVQTTRAENAQELRWDEKTISQKYDTAEFGEPLRFYSNMEKKAAAEEVGELIGTAYMSGYDIYTDTYYHCQTKAYQVIGRDEREVTAIQFEDDENYYLYKNVYYESER